ncbi:PP2C family protein-serine/threonine phosphatase [Kitasatospora sp. NBC_01539]|uniref:PP2C family protein-serine/threonine phosphatase n=1 Tax=Kitasatospora sp. NBC_01539 TaxID=2903577 RepID=UPI0038601CCE
MKEPGWIADPADAAPAEGWAAGLHRLWLAADAAPDVTALSVEIYDLLLAVPGVLVVTGCRYDASGRARYVRGSTVAGTTPVQTRRPPGRVRTGTGEPRGRREVREFGIAEAERDDRPELGVWRSAGAALLVECVVVLEDGDRAAVVVGVGPGAPPPAGLHTMLAQACDTVDACNARVLRERENDRRQARDALLAEASLQMDASLDIHETLQRVARMAVPAVAEGCLVHLWPQGRPELVAVAHLAAAAQERLAAVGRDEAWTGRVLREATAGPGGLLLAGADLADGPFAPGGPVPCQVVTVNALRARGRTLGAITFAYDRDPRLVPSPAFLADLALRAALAIDNATLYEQRRLHVMSLQRHLLPAALPRMPGLELASAYEVGDAGLDVGGDFYDAVPGPDGELSLVVGDVCGRGAQAAALTGLARHTLRTLLEDGCAPAPALGRLNRALRANAASRFVTAVVARLAPVGDGSFRMRTASAGHPPGYAVRADGTVEVFNTAGGLLLGVLDDHEVAETRCHLRPGDTAVLLTDGVTESRSADGTFFEERLPGVLAGLAGLAPEKLVTELARAALAFRTTGADDMAVLAVRVTPTGPTDRTDRTDPTDPTDDGQGAR